MPVSRSLNVLFLSTSVGPLGSGLGGGVELTLQNMAQTLRQRGHRITVVAPMGSVLPDFMVVQIPGTLQTTAQDDGRNAWITLPGHSVLGNMWEYAYQVQTEYDVILNFAYDWLPFYLTPFFACRVLHLVSMGSLTDAMDQAIEKVVERFPGTVAMHSRAQADTFTFGDRCQVIGNGFDLSRYQFQAHPDKALAWVGRLAPEKGLEDAVRAAQATGLPLRIWGALQHDAYWQDICDQYPDAPVSYEGFLPTAELQRALGQCLALLMTPRWVEAFGNVAVEAMACGVPVIAYERGGPAEIVQHGKTGWLVEPDSVAELIAAIAKIDQLSRYDCREYVQQTYSLDAMGDRLEHWFAQNLSH